MAMEADFGWFRDEGSLAALVDPAPPREPGLPEMPSAAFPYFIRHDAKPTRAGTSLMLRAARCAPVAPEADAGTDRPGAGGDVEISSSEAESSEASSSEQEHGGPPAAKRPREQARGATGHAISDADESAGVMRGRRGQPRTHRRGVEAFYERVLSWGVADLLGGTREAVGLPPLPAGSDTYASPEHYFAVGEAVAVEEARAGTCAGAPPPGPPRDLTESTLPGPASGRMACCGA